MAPGVAFVDPDHDFMVHEHADDHDRHGHGTTCTRLFLEGAPDSVAVPVRVFGTRLETSPLTIENAVNWCIARNIKLVNLSLGTNRVEARNTLYRVCHAACRAGMIIVAASRTGSYPAMFDVVLSAGLSQTAVGPEFEYRDGEAIEIVARLGHTTPDGIRVDHSSYVAPLITALVARMLEREPLLNLEGVRARLRVHNSLSQPDRIGEPTSDFL